MSDIKRRSRTASQVVKTNSRANKQKSTKTDTFTQKDKFWIKELKSNEDTRIYLSSNSLIFHYDIHSAFFNPDEAGDYKNIYDSGGSIYNNVISGVTKISMDNNLNNMSNNNSFLNALYAKRKFEHEENDIYVPKEHVKFYSTINQNLNASVSNAQLFLSSLCIHNRTFEVKESNFERFVMFKPTCKFCGYYDGDYVVEGFVDTENMKNCQSKDVVKNSVNYFPNFDQFEDGAYYYSRFFFGIEHENYFKQDENMGPVIISLMRTTIPSDVAKLKKSKNDYSIMKCVRVIVRTSSTCALRAVLPLDWTNKSSHSYAINHVIKVVLPGMDPSSFVKSISNREIQEKLKRLDEMAIKKHHKIGVILCKKGQTQENEFYSNDTATPEFTRFLKLIANKVKLKNFDKYLGGLDAGDGTCGKSSYFIEFCNQEVMFHVSTEIPSSGENDQQINKKRHLGNNTVTVIFVDDENDKIDISTFISRFQHVFIIVRPAKYKNGSATAYNVSICRSEDVPAFGPCLPHCCLKINPNLRGWFITLIINADAAATKCFKLSNILMRTRFEFMTDIIQIYTSKVSKNKTPSPNRNMKLPSMKVNNFSFPGSLLYQIIVKFPGTQEFDYCLLLISDKKIVFLSRHEKAPIFTIPRCRVYGWEKLNANTVQLYFSSYEKVEFIITGKDTNQLSSLFTSLMLCTDANKVVNFSWSDEYGNIDKYFEIGVNGLIEKILVVNNVLKNAGFILGNFINFINGGTILVHNKAKNTQILSELKINKLKIFSFNKNRSDENLNVTLELEDIRNVIFANCNNEKIEYGKAKKFNASSTVLPKLINKELTTDGNCVATGDLANILGLSAQEKNSSKVLHKAKGSYLSFKI